MVGGRVIAFSPNDHCLISLFAPKVPVTTPHTAHRRVKPINHRIRKLTLSWEPRPAARQGPRPPQERSRANPPSPQPSSPVLTMITRMTLTWRVQASNGQSPTLREGGEEAPSSRGATVAPPTNHSLTHLDKLACRGCFIRAGTVVPAPSAIYTKVARVLVFKPKNFLEYHAVLGHMRMLVCRMGKEACCI